MHATGRQVYMGLAGFIIIEDPAATVALPSTYGVDDLPLVILAGLLTIVVFVRHTENIQRLIHGEEQRLRKEGK